MSKPTFVVWNRMRATSPWYSLYTGTDEQIAQARYEQASITPRPGRTVRLVRYDGEGLKKPPGPECNGEILGWGWQP